MGLTSFGFSEFVYENGGFCTIKIKKYKNPRVKWTDRKGKKFKSTCHKEGYLHNMRGVVRK